MRPSNNKHSTMLCRVLLVLMNLLLFQGYEAQNLVPNGSFEEFEECPSTLYADAYGLSSWSSSRFSVDLYSACGNQFTGIPSNSFGYQEAFSGDSYVGFGAFKLFNPELKEHLLTELISPLTIGETYYFSMWLSPGEAERDLGTNGMGCMLTNIPYYHEFDGIQFVGNPSPLDRAMISTTDIITDTIGWTQMKGSFVADSTYQYLIIGGFDVPGGNDTLHLRPNAFSGEAYYFLDDVRLSTDSVFAYSENPSSLKERVLSEFVLFPNPFIDELMLPIAVEGISAVEFYDIRGARVHEAAVIHRRIQGLGHLETGIYLLQLIGQEGTIGYSRVVKLE